MQCVTDIACKYCDGPEVYSGSLRYYGLANCTPHITSLTGNPTGSLRDPYDKKNRFVAGLIWLTGAMTSAINAQELNPGLHDLVVYDPGTHERGLPAPEFIPMSLEG